MNYFYDRNESVLQVKLNAENYSAKKKLNEILMPEADVREGVGFSTAGLISLSELISFITEKDMLYFVFFLLKANAEWSERADTSLELIMHPDAIFYSQKKNRFYFAVCNAGNNDIGIIDFIMNLLFDAVYKEKELQTAVELIDFIKASIHTSPRDVVLFLEMSKYGRSFSSDWSKLKRNIDDSASHTDSLPEAHKNSKMFNKVNNSMDFSSFLSVDDLFSDAQYDVEEKPAEPKVTKPEIRQEKEVVQRSSYNEPEIFIQEQKQEEVTPVQNVQTADVQADILFSGDEYEDIPFVEKEPVNQQENADVWQDSAEEESQDDYPIAEEEPEISDDENQTVILTEEETEKEIAVASLIDSDGNVFDVYKDYFVIGRNSKESDLSVRDSSMSRKHAAIIKSGNEFYIEDLNSTNKTYVDGRQVTPGIRKQLKDGSVIFVSKNKYVFNVRIEKC